MDGPTSKTSSLSSFSPGPFPGLVERVAGLLEYLGIEGYLVGGIVRDALLDRETEDVDIAVAGDVEGTGRILADRLGGRFVRLHEEWDIARVVVPSDDTQRIQEGHITIGHILCGLLEESLSG